jgi:Acyclic terpene utilisation family protein AtuA
MTVTTQTVRVGCGSAYAEDRIDLAVDMVERGDVRYLCMDGLAERTLALAHQRRDPVTGEGSYDVRIPALAEEVVPRAAKRGVTIVASMGGANPAAAGRYLVDAARRQGLEGVRIGVIEGDDVTRYATERDPVILETGEPLSKLGRRIIAANAYLGAEPIVEALRQDADVVLGGRIADPSLFVGPIAYELGWRLDDWDRIAAATVVGHLLECGNHVTGGNFADPPYRVVPSFRRPSFPLAEVRDDGSALVAKLPDTDGLLSIETCKMQLGYEIGDPGAYLTPDVTADFTRVSLQPSNDGVAVAGAAGRERPGQLKALVAVEDGFIGEGQVSFGGPGALGRAELGRQILDDWLEPILKAGGVSDLKVDLLGLDSMHGPATVGAVEPYEVHLRVAARCDDPRTAERVADAGWYLQIFGPAAVGGHRKLVRPVIGMYSFFLPREEAPTTVSIITT